MGTAEFLRAVTPCTGHKIIAELVPHPSRPKPGWKYHCFESYDAAAAKALELDQQGKTVYFACNGYGDWYFDEKKQKNRLRTAVNVVACRALYDDIDVAKPGCYATRKEAGEALKEFLAASGLPAPLVIYSGARGLHLYWPFNRDLTPQDWVRLSKKKRSVMDHAGLKIDAAVTTDLARVLRPVGATWRKEDAIKVTAKLVKGPFTVEGIEATLDSYIYKNKLIPPPNPNEVPEHMRGEAGNLADFGTDFAPASFVTIADRCNQIRLFATTGCGDEPTWHKCLGVAVHAEDGRDTAHQWSSQYDGYSYEETEAKMNEWEAGPTTCAKFREINPSGCAGCTERCKSPIQLGVIVLPTVGGDWLDEMNKQVVFIEKEAAIYRTDEREYFSLERFNALYANRTVTVPAAGNATKEVSQAYLWLRSLNRRQYRAIVTRPGEPEETTDRCLNDWAGFTASPASGDIGPFKRLYAHLFGSESFPMLWLAHLIQHPGIKMFVALVVWSQAEGVGKNLLFEAVGALFDRRHFALIGQSEVDDDFCGWIPGTVFVLADEIRASKSDKSRDRLKLWQTSTMLRTHDKGQPKREVENLMNMVFLSNHADGMFLSDHDRRFFVHEVTAGPLPESIKRDFLAWRDNGGLPALLHYLQQIDLDGFDPKGRAPVTDSKRMMIEAGRSDLDRWAHDVVSGALPIGHEVATGEELTRRFVAEYPNMRQPPSVATVVKVLVRAGAFSRQNQVRLTNGRKVRGLALLRTDFWKNAPEASWREELEKRA